ncbi:PAS domain-containing protein [Litorisediminicola beolgyonensis]|uniref:PAS domain-containing protein n=1 Tax=Litorisediminicola beolgyonensis TaxID=1173614 RepID=A0ABW3ZGS5_9RHOB
MLDSMKQVTLDIEEARKHGVDIDVKTAMLMSFSPDCIKLLSTSGDLLFMSRNGTCAMEIADPAPLYGRKWWDLWPDQERDRLRDAVDLAATGRTVNFVAECPTARGTPACWNVMVAGVPTSDGQVKELLAISVMTEEAPSELLVT